MILAAAEIEHWNCELFLWFETNVVITFAQNYNAPSFLFFSFLLLLFTLATAIAKAAYFEGAGRSEAGPQSKRASFHSVMCLSCLNDTNGK